MMITIDNDGDHAARKIIGISFNLARRGMQNTTGYRLLLMKRHSYMFDLTNGRSQRNRRKAHRAISD